MDESTKWLTVEMAAQRLNLSKDTVYRLAKNKTIPSYKSGDRKIVFDVSDLDIYIMQSRKRKSQ